MKPFNIEQAKAGAKVMKTIKELQQEQTDVDLEKEAVKFVQSKEFIESKESPVLLTARHFAEWGAIHLNAERRSNMEQELIPLPEEKMGRYINYCLQREDDECHCPSCGKFVTGLRLFPYYYDRKNNDVYFASVCPECGKIIISKE